MLLDYISPANPTNPLNLFSPIWKHAGEYTYFEKLCFLIPVVAFIAAMAYFLWSILFDLKP